MKRLLLVISTVIIVCGLLFSGCSESAETPEPESIPTSAPAVTSTSPSEPAATTTPEPAPTSTTSEVIELKFAHSYPPMSGLGVALDNWAKKIQEDTNGGVEITIYPGGTLFKPHEFYTATASGVTDIAYGDVPNGMDYYALETVLNLPGLSWPEPYPEVLDMRMEVLEGLREKFPEITEAHKDVVTLFDVVMPPFVFHSPKKAVRTPDDIKGLKVAAGGWYVTLASILEAVPVSIPAPDRYTAFERGTVEGSWDVWGGIFALKWYEVSDNYLEGVEFGDSSATVIMNMDKYNALPDDIKEIFKANQQYGYEQAAWGFTSAGELGIAEAEKLGATFLTPTPEEVGLWQDALRPSCDAWIQEQADRGLPAQEVFDEMLHLIEQYK